MKRVLHVLFLFVIVIALIYFFSRQKDALSLLRGINVNGVYILVGISPLFLLSNALILKKILHLFNVQLLLRECMGLCSATAAGNLLISFGGGTITKAVYLERRHAFPYTAFLSSMSAVYLIDLLLVGVLGSTVIALKGLLDSREGIAAFVGFLFLGVIALVIMTAPVRFKGLNGWIAMKLGGLVRGWERIKSDRNLIFTIGLLLLINNILAAIELMAGYYAFSTEVDFPTALLIGMLTGLLTVIKLTPANLGVQEGVIAFSSTVMGIGFEKGLLAATLIRIVSMVMIFISAGIFGGYLFSSNDSSKRCNG